MFPSATQSRNDLTERAAADYRVARNRQAELQQKRNALLAMPLSTSEQVAIARKVIDRSRRLFEAHLNLALEAMARPDFNMFDADDMDALNFCGVSGHPHGYASSAAVTTALAGTILAHVETRARASGGDQSNLTLAKRHAELARFEVLIAEQETISSQTLFTWRQATGDLQGYP